MSGSLHKEFLHSTCDRQYFSDLRLSMSVMFELKWSGCHSDEFKIPWKLISWENILIFVAGSSGSVSDLVLMLLLNTSPTFKYFLKMCEAWDLYIYLDLGSQLRLTVLFLEHGRVKCSKIKKKYWPKYFLEYCSSLSLRESQGYRTEIFIWSGWVCNLFLMSRLSGTPYLDSWDLSPLFSWWELGGQAVLPCSICPWHWHRPLGWIQHQSPDIFYEFLSGFFFFFLF